jgi:hypothetical protein
MDIRGNLVYFFPFWYFCQEKSGNPAVRFRSKWPHLGVALVGLGTGLPDFSWHNIPNGKNIPNGYKIHQLATKYTKWK